jgi:hypothetical protein
VSQTLTADDFFSGLFAALALDGWKKVSIREERFDQALEHVFRELVRLSRAQGVNPRFRIRSHRTHGDSITVRDAIAHAAQRDIVSLDNPEFQDIRLKIGIADAEAILNGVPGRRTLFTPLAKEFARRYPRPA